MDLKMSVNKIALVYCRKCENSERIEKGGGSRWPPWEAWCTIRCTFSWYIFHPYIKYSKF